ncbi:glutamate--cysteine ligase [Streptomyces violascens]|uniref:carboxylate-amine ligase n=1 Tax=Streptomyces violascens TaxID=67381 RepID=UPI00378B3D80
MEEEFLLVDPYSRTLAPAAETVIATASAQLGTCIGPELTAYQVETRTDPHTELSALAEQLYTTRLTTAQAASSHGVHLMASGAPVLAPPGPPPLMPGDRYARSSTAHGALADEEVACACHVHIGLADRGQALAVSNHLRIWLPTLTALTANSPFWTGRDTAHDSWRCITRHRWPVSGPPPLFTSLAHYEDLVATLVATQTCPDTGGIYWDIRPSHTQPTLEVRIADAQPTVDDTILLTAIIRAAATTALHQVLDDRPPPDPDPQLLRAACWRAARDGLTGTAINLTHRHLEPAHVQLRRLRDWIAPALTAHPDDAKIIDARLRQIERTGTGAQRQRTAHARRNRLEDVVDTLTAQTLTPPNSPT